MSIARNVMVTFELTPRQRREIESAAGTVKPTVDLPLLQLVALTLAAVAAGRDVLPVATSPDTIQRILHPERAEADGVRPFTVRVPLDDAQRERIRELTGRTLSWFEIAPYERTIRYRETWEHMGEPVRIGRSLAIVPHGAEAVARDEGRVVVALPVVDDGARGVWGTGRHPTTQLALILLEEHARPSLRVLDVGTGSGILAVAAARLGASAVTAVDVDEDSVVCARETARINGLEAVVDVRAGSLEVGAPPYDLVTMNVLPHVIMALSTEVRRSLRPGGVLIVSGLPSEAAAESALSALRSAGFRLETTRTQEGWIAAALRAPDEAAATDPTATH